MIGMTYGLLRINRVNTMTPRQNDLVVKKPSLLLTFTEKDLKQDSATLALIKYLKFKNT